jgi:ABC-type molybdate transport system permease subunit
MKVAAKLEDVVQTAGISLLVACIASFVTLALAPTDSGQREFGHGAVRAVCFLYLIWAPVAIGTFVLRQNSVSQRFRLVFSLLNICMLVLILLFSN